MKTPPADRLDDAAALQNSGRRSIAAFDFDGTLSRRDTLIPFLVRVAGRRRFSAVSANLGLLGARRRVPLGDRDHLKELMIRDLLGGMKESDLRASGESYARDLLVNRMNIAVVERLRQHREAGHELLFVSASLVYYLEPMARSLGVDTVIAVEPSTVDGVLDGALTRPNVRAEQKAIRLKEWIDATSGSTRPSDLRRMPEVWAYGNSSGDHALLEAADHAFWVGSPRKRPATAVQFVSAPLSH